jgi:hypothetical protein
LTLAAALPICRAGSRVWFHRAGFGDWNTLHHGRPGESSAGKVIPFSEKSRHIAGKKAYGGENVEEINHGCG